MKIEIKWALIFAACSLGWMFFEKSMGWHDIHIDQHAVYTNFFAIIAILIYVLALRDKRKNYYDGQMTLKQGFVSGAIISLIVALLSPVNQYITLTYITPAYFTNVIEYSVSSGKLTQEAAEGYFTLKNYIIQASVGALIMGLITSVIVALFMKSKTNK